MRFFAFFSKTNNRIGKFKNGHFWPKLTQIWPKFGLIWLYQAWSMGFKKKFRKKFFFQNFSENVFWTPVVQAWYSQIWPNLGQIWVNFDQKGTFLKFPKKAKMSFFFDSRDYASSKKLGKSDARFSKKMRKTSIFCHFGPKSLILDSFWPKWPKWWKWSKKRLEHFS